MIHNIIQKENGFVTLLVQLAKLSMNPDNRQFLQDNLHASYENRNKAENDLVKYSVWIMIATFIYVLLDTVTIENVSIMGLTMKDSTIIRLFFPVIILYYNILFMATEIYRMQNLFVHATIQGILHPDVMKGRTNELFMPFSLSAVLRGNGKGLFSWIINLSYNIIFGFITFSGVFCFIYAIKKGIELDMGKTFSFKVAIIFQVTLLILLFSSYTKKWKVAKMVISPDKQIAGDDK